MKIFVKSKRKIFIFLVYFFGAVILFAGALKIGIFFYENRKHTFVKIGWVTDIHAGGQRERKQTELNIIFPREYDTYLDAAFKRMKAEGINFVITSGDNTDKGEIKYAERLVAIAKDNEMNVIWTKGNHDREKNGIMKQLGLEKNYYTFDIGDDIMVIVLNNAKIDIYPNGEIDAEQFEWFKNVLKNTHKDKKIILSMHVPIIEPTKNFIITPQYKEFEKLLSQSDNIVFVLFGHRHMEFDAEINGVHYWAGNPLTLKDRLGSYYILDIDNETVISADLAGLE
ncbi:MAG: metallophosphoesterase [Candidatus Moranbacteria bacterium]|jgi:predicted phosphodiesterase|nr:metallophosphoesterase [Candidatus Moranbacteria bacterium]